MNESNPLSLVSVAVLCGVLLSSAFVNPYSGQVTLSELVLQLSGSRGDLPLGTSLPELLSFSIKMVPYFLFELYIGVYLYRHFCTASVYVFSRTVHRTRWYAKECLKICGAGILYQVALLGTVIIVTHCRYDVVWQGLLVLITHFVLYGLWLFAMVMLVNILSILLGSENSFAIVLGGQVVFITLLALPKSNYLIQFVVLKINPMARLVLGWQSSGIEGLDVLGGVLRLQNSLSYIVFIVSLILIGGGILVKKHDFITVDAEFGGT